MMMGEVVVVHQIATRYIIAIHTRPRREAGYTNGTFINSINTSCTADIPVKKGHRIG